MLCKLGGHTWEWGYVRQQSCVMQQVCTQCGRTNVSSKVEHKWVWIALDNCTTVQKCARCGDTGRTEQKEHSWTRIDGPHPFEWEEKCDRCGTTRRPSSGVACFVGQHQIKANLFVSIEATRARSEPLHHLLLSGQPGMGKASLAKAIAEQMEAEIRTLSGSALRRPGDLAAVLTNLHPGDVLLIEHIESVGPQVVEPLTGCLVDCSVQIYIGKGAGARPIHLKLPRFTAIGTTAKLSQVESRLRHSMVAYQFSPYEVKEIAQIVLLQAAQLPISVDSEAAVLLARCSEGCPAIAALVLKRVRDYATVRADERITRSVAEEALASLGYGDRLSISESGTGGLKTSRPPIPDDVKIFVWQRDGGHCVKCGSHGNLEFDHIIPLAKGGSNTARNLQLLCEECNRRKSASIA